MGYIVIVALTDTCDLLMDTNVILDFVYNGNYTKNLILDFADGKKINFVILETIKTEWHNIERKGDIHLHRDQLDAELIQYGTIQEIPIQYYSKAQLWAERLYRQEKFKRPLSGDTLSRNDCMLLRWALDNYNYTLVTRDNLLIFAYESMCESMYRKCNIFVPKKGVNIQYNREQMSHLQNIRINETR